MRYVVKTDAFKLDEQQKCLAKSLGISEDFVRLLLGRGLREDGLYTYLHPSADNMSSPFDIDGMAEAVKRVQRAIEDNEKILIFGDYDCDGICAVSILMLYLRDKTRVTYFIPDRNKDGYGISIGALERLIPQKRPSLVITVDCGITAVGEVEYLNDKGIDVIVTDHHEPQEQIPKCIVLDPKIGRHGFCDYCGAGVALKLVEALAGRQEALKYADIAAIATIADVVPLVDDNRIIAYLGLRQMLTAPRKGIKMLLGNDGVSSQNIMFRLAPRMNAAGRLNSAMKVVDLFLETDYFMLKTLAEELIRDNQLRQELCENVVADAKKQLCGADFAKIGIIMLYSENWEAGVLGIAASKLVEEFKRPAVLFSKNGNSLKGSARSIPSVNIFELFNGLGKYFTSFGGHAQAAGVSLDICSFEAFRHEANDIVLSTHTAQDFIPDIRCEMKLPLDFDFLSFAKELELMQPFGYGNARPNFLLSAKGLKFDKIGYSNHVKCSTKNIDILGFYNYADSFTAKTGELDLEVSLDINEFRNTLTAQGIIKSAAFKTVEMSREEARMLNLYHLNFAGNRGVEDISLQNVEDMLKNSPFGTVVVCFSADEYNDICKKSNAISEMPVFIGKTQELNPRNCVIVCPSEDFDFAYYSCTVIAGAPLSKGYLNSIESERVVALGEVKTDRIEFSDDELRAIYKALASIAASKVRASNLHALYLAVLERCKTSESVFLLAMMIFKQLELVKIGDRGALIIDRKSVDLNSSVAYRVAKGLQ